MQAFGLHKLALFLDNGATCEACYYWKFSGCYNSNWSGSKAKDPLAPACADGDSIPISFTPKSVS